MSQTDGTQGGQGAVNHIYKFYIYIYIISCKGVYEIVRVFHQQVTLDLVAGLVEERGVPAGLCILHIFVINCNIFWQNYPG